MRGLVGRFALFALFALFAACGGGSKAPTIQPNHGTLHLVAPAAIAGDVVITFENDLQGFDQSANLCKLSVNGENLMPNDRILESGGLADLHLRAGTYHLESSKCTGEYVPKDLTVTGLMTVHLP